MSKILVGLVIAASAIGAPALSFAQSNAPLTRAEVLADLVRFQEAGYNPSRGNDPYYPANVQAAQAKIAAQKAQQVTTAPALSFAQSNSPLTRAEVLADLVRFQEAGYNPSRGNDPYYPANVQAAQAKIAAQEAQQLGTEAVGGVAQNGKLRQPLCE